MLQRHRPILYALLLALALILKMGYRHRLGMETVPAWGDAVDYDNLGLSLARGHGFSVDFQDPEFQAPYRNSGFSSLYDNYYRLEARGLTMFRPPLFPWLVSGHYAAFGRHYTPVRITQFLLTAVSLALVFFLLWRHSPATAIFYALVALFEPTLARHAVNLLTEPLAAAMLCAWFACELLPHRYAAAAAGFFAGLLLLARPIFAIGLALALLVKAAAQKSLRGAILTGVVATMTCLPFMIRNCRLSHRFTPFGTHGTIMLAYAYSDASYQNGHVDFTTTPLVYKDANPSGPNALLVSELTIADAEGKTFRQWLGKNFWKVPYLVLSRILENFTPSNFGEAMVLLFSMLGLGAVRTSPIARLAALFLLYNTAGVALMWAHGNRFNFPVLPLQYVLVAYGLQAAFAFAKGLKTRKPSVSSTRA